MCLLCDGMTWEEIDRREEMIYAVYGWMLHSVEQDGGTGWAYTVGLSENFDHPDIVMNQGDITLQIELVRQVAEAAVGGGAAAVEKVLSRTRARLVPADMAEVHPEQYAAWLERYNRLSRPGEFLRLAWC